MNKKNIVTEVRYSYAGPWPGAIIAITFGIIMGYLIANYIFEVKLLVPAGLFGNTLVAVVLVFSAFRLVKKYPSNNSDGI